MRNLFPYNAIMRCKLSNSFIRLSLRTFPPITYNVSAYLKLRSNLGGGFCIKAVTRYAVLADVFLFFCFLIRKLVLKNFQISFSV